MPRFLKAHSVIPGFGFSLGFSLFYLGLIVLLPLFILCLQLQKIDFTEFLHIITEARIIHAYKISFGLSFLAALINSFFGFIIAWILVRYNFIGKRIFDSLIDLPFAMPTAVSGIALASLYAENGWIGKYLIPYHIKIAFTPLGIVIALMFVGFPFVVRSVEPILKDLSKDVEEAAASLGASRWQAFYKVILPQTFPSILTGFAMSFARGLGEYGSVIFIAGNMPYVSEIIPLIIVIKLEQYDYNAASAIAILMLIASFIMLFAINLLQKWQRKSH